MSEPEIYPAIERPIPREAFSTKEVAEMLGVSQALVKDLIRRNELKSVKAGRRRLISRHAMLEFLRDAPI